MASFKVFFFIIITVVTTGCSLFEKNATNHIIKVTATGKVPSLNSDMSFNPENLFDGDLKTSWQTRGPDGALNKYVFIVFDEPVDITTIRLANGFQLNHSRYGDLYSKNSRVAKLKICLNHKNCSIHSVSDTRDWIAIPTKQDSVKNITIYILSRYKGTKWDDVSISEIQILSSVLPYGFLKYFLASLALITVVFLIFRNKALVRTFVRKTYASFVGVVTGMKVAMVNETFSSVTVNTRVNASSIVVKALKSMLLSSLFVGFIYSMYTIISVNHHQISILLFSKNEKYVANYIIVMESLSGNDIEKFASECGDHLGTIGTSGITDPEIIGLDRNTREYCGKVNELIPKISNISGTLIMDAIQFFLGMKGVPKTLGIYQLSQEVIAKEKELERGRANIRRNYSDVFMHISALSHSEKKYYRLNGFPLPRFPIE